MVIMVLTEAKASYLNMPHELKSLDTEPERFLLQSSRTDHAL